MRFVVLPAEVEEIHEEQLTLMEVCQINAYRKARVVSKEHPSALVLGADTLVGLDGKLFGKPATREEAARMLGQLQGRTHQVVTGVCLLCLQGHQCCMFAEQTDVTFRRLSAADIRRYHELSNPLDKAGAYAIQERGDLIVEKTSGSFSNVVGLPIERLRDELAAFALAKLRKGASSRRLR